MLGKPDNFAISREEWKKDFPLDPYGDEDNVTKWGKETVVYNSEIDTSKKKKWEIEDLKNWMEGYYLIEATTKDKYGEEVKDMRYFTVYSATSLKEPLPDIDFKILKKISGEPGENAEFLINTKHKNRILYEIEHEHEIIQSEWINTENEKSSDLKLISIPIREIYRGNFGVHLTFIINNRFYSKDFNITVPFTNKELVIEYETFRDKLNPGQEEEWKVKISGKKGEKIAAEFLASMYDASLDAFASNNYHWNIYGSTNISKSWNAGFSFTKSSGRTFVRNWNTNVSRSSRSYDQLNWFGLNYRYYRGRDKYGLKRKSKMATAGSKAMDRSIDMDEMDDAVEESAAEAPSPEPSMALEKKEMAKPQKNGDSKDNEGSSGGSEENSQKEVQIRSNFSETAFFFPVLETDPEGRVIFKFKIPDSLTKWKFLGLAHTQDLKIGYTENSTVTQKDLMVVPNPPRFFREGDTIQFTSKINNLSEEDFNGEINLKLFDSLTMKPIEEKFGISDKPQNFTSKKGESGVVDWKLKIPEGVSAVTYRIIGKAGKFSDGEEMTIPILTNRMLVTESLPLPIRGKETKTYEFKKLLNSPAPGKDSSATLRHHNLTLEFTNNPAWYAVQAIPYLMEYPYECIEQTFTRYYANSLSRHIVNSNPKIKKVFDAWKKIPDS
ncbi:MAG: hypothetical protein KDK36_11405, partial [Leptospiraceae bacterium]|nr:hypothetical protein [Leptospiraceae bacterium]